MLRGFLLRLQAQTGIYEASVNPATADMDLLTNLLRVSLVDFSDDSMRYNRFIFYPLKYDKRSCGYFPLIRPGFNKLPKQPIFLVEG